MWIGPILGRTHVADLDPLKESIGLQQAGLDYQNYMIFSSCRKRGQLNSLLQNQKQPFSYLPFSSFLRKSLEAVLKEKWVLKRNPSNSVINVENFMLYLRDYKTLSMNSFHIIIFPKIFFWGLQVPQPIQSLEIS